MASLNLTQNLKEHDDVYQALMDMHRDMSDEQSEKANAKLILLLANHIGDPAVLAEAAAVVRANTLGDAHS